MATGNPDVAVVRTRELELRYRVHRLDAPLKGSLEEPQGVTMFAEELLRDAIADAVIVLHLTKRLRLLGVHRLPKMPNDAIVAEVLRAALLSNAATLIYVHRRLTDDWADGHDDVLVGLLRQAARMFDVELRDAITIWSLPHELTYHSCRDDHAL